MKPMIPLLPLILLLWWFTAIVRAGDTQPRRTTLTDPDIRYTKPDKPYVILKRGDVEAVVVDNSAVDDEVLPDHKAGYSGVASLTHARQRRNLFVPAYAGLNFEHCHDGTKKSRQVLFEPRHAPMHLRRISEHVVELYQAPTPHYRLESCQRYEILPDGTLELTFECIPRDRTFGHGYIGIFFASYIHQPESLDIHFRGRDEGNGASPDRWVRGVTPRHGERSTHRAVADRRTFFREPDFPLTLVFNFSNQRYREPWYYGVSRGMALAFIFRDCDQVRLTQSPSGGGEGNPAWDFQWFVPEYEVGRCYTFIMRAMYFPFELPEQVAQRVAPHRTALSLSTSRPSGRLDK